MKQLLMLVFIIGAFGNLHAQTFEVPKYEFKTAEDYSKHSDDIVKAIAWLTATAPNQEAAKRQAVSAYVMKWMTGTPTVSLGIDPNIVTFIESPDLFMLFMAGWSSYSIQKNDKDAKKGTLAGLETVIEYYTKNKSQLRKDKNVEKYVKMKSKGKLESFVNKNVK